ncbi:MAG: sigma-70 domain-containing protein [Candidatus Bipolaricaulis sp.]|nr:sigma-70 domain-containing protein [Candidatus Bipolaricaulis sp.]MDD5646004.1 sigma-70 domain-containing protein [Candidatus Bipolaricaulis sp.]
MATNGRRDGAPRDADADLIDLLRRGDADGSVREEALRRATPWVYEVIAESFARSGYSAEDLFRAGYLGLLNAVCNLELARGRPFREYAGNLIRGEIRQHIRDREQSFRVPPWMNDLNRQIETAEARLLRETGRLPTLSELADAVNISEEGVVEIFKAREALSYVSLDIDQRAKDPAPTIDAERIRGKRPTAFPIEHRIRIASALDRLAELQQYLFRHLFEAPTDASSGPTD